MNGNTLLYLAAGATFSVLVLTALGKWVVLPLWRLTVKTGHFLDSWNGEPARDGLPGRPGVVERITSIEYQLHPNNGGSMKDAVNRIESKVDEQATAAAEVKRALEERQGAIENELHDVWRSLASRDVTQAAQHLAVAADRAEAAKAAQPDEEKP
jgi:hypothetical protein